MPTVARVAIAVAVLAAASMSLRVVQLDLGPLPDLATQQAHVEITGVITQDPAFEDRLTFGGTSDRQVRVVIRAEQLSFGVQRSNIRDPVLVIGDATGWEDLHVGDSITTSGQLQTADQSSPLAAVLFADDVSVVARAPAILQAAESMRRGLRDATEGTSDDVQGLLPALVVGDTSAMPTLLVADLRASGLAHLTAVSGANVAIVVAAAMLLARWVGVRGWALIGFGLVVVGWFVILARPQPSVMRAAVMGSVGIVGVAVAGRAQALRALIGSIVLLLIVDPWLSRSWGFALSVAATAGLVILARRWADALPARWPRPLRDAIAVACAAQVATLPLVVALSGQVSVVAVIANVLAAPAVAPATVLGATAAAVSPIAPALALSLAWLARWPTAWIAGVAHRAAATPGADIAWPSGIKGALLCMGALGAATAGWLVLQRVFARQFGQAWVSRWMATISIATAGVLLVAYLLGPARWPPSGWVLVMCDVGQGDALVVNLDDNAALVVDAGPDPALVDRCLDQLDVVHIPLLVLTHFHSDHVNGVPGVLSGRDVDTVLVTNVREPPEQVAQVATWTRGVDVREALAGQRGSWGATRWRVLWPTDVGVTGGSPPNNASVVMLVRTDGIRILLTGDIETEAQQALMQSDAIPRVDVFKVPHHGSSRQEFSLFDATDASIALISVGQDNPYGHPAAETLDALEQDGMDVMRTDEDRTVAVVVDGTTVKAVSMP
jgi:competence protein ComEC